MNIFLLRGLVREKEHWGEFKKLIHLYFPEANIITPEIQGVGEFVDQISPNNFRDMVQFMRQKNQEYFHSNSNNIIIAMSLGGMMIKQWLEMYPQDFKKVILINTSFKGINPISKRLRILTLLNFIKIFISRNINNRERSIIKIVSNLNKDNEEIIKSWVAIQKKRPVSKKSFINQIKAALNFKTNKNWPKEIPLLILASKKDKLCHYSCSEKLSKLWQGEFHLHSSAGHDLPLDDGEWLLKKIKNWI